MNKTQLLELADGLLVKMEINNLGGSHKYRAADFIIQSAIARGDIDSTTTVIEKTGGNFGFGLLASCLKRRIPVELAIGLSFSSEKRRLLRKLGATLIGEDLLHAGRSPKDVVDWHLANQTQLGKKYFYTDQFNNPDSLLAHCDTGKEIAQQIQMMSKNIQNILFIACAGTGASITGITRALIQTGIHVKTILVEPEGCDSFNGIYVNHSIEGMSVGVPPPFLDRSLIDRQEFVHDGKIERIKHDVFVQYGYMIGNTSAACFDVAKKYLHQIDINTTKILILFYDHGFWYAK